MRVAAPAGRLPVLVLAGPTGAGKTQWAVQLAEHAPVEIVSVDSALVYRGLDIGTAKPSRAMRARHPHHLVDVCEPTESYSAGRFVRDALRCIGEIHARRRIPLLVGGTMLYLRALLDGLAPLPAAAAPLRAAIDARASQLGWPALHAELSRLDPAAAGRIAPQDAQRIQRALEVCWTTGQPMSELQRGTVSPLAGWPLRYWLLVPTDRSALHQSLAARLGGMMAAGFLEEVRQLRGRGDLTARHPSMRAVGYRQLWAHLDGRWPLDEAIARALAATRQLAKRQLTWMRAERRALRLDPAGGPLSWIRDISADTAALGL
ncbi:MAG: tRNA (adenosine(37)-N6)-dimethylallyltransferase MiaA [Gammaproteobacteria bacterium]|nr:tRNA (adenosine(37)-N6)-dimethylallyltransferase MiaA [Gammaproteobacteria bacterium]MBV9621715.1 tRNA (adenosine(37)-N6)-dimethylallyltransferase MiaA [Gammaproteobacteria bacterium]